MAFIAGGGSGTPPGGTPVATSNGQPDPQQVNLAHLMALVQQQQQQPQQVQQQSTAPPVAAAGVPAGLTPSQALMYQQLLLQNLQQQQPPTAAPQPAFQAVTAGAGGYSVQQLQQILGQLHQPTAAPAAPVPPPPAAAFNPAALLQLSGANPNALNMNALGSLGLQQQLLQQLSLQQQQPQQPQQAPMNPAMMTVFSTLLSSPALMQQLAPLLSAFTSSPPSTTNPGPPTAPAVSMLYSQPTAPASTQGDDTKALIEFMLRQQQEQQQQQQQQHFAAAYAVSANQTPRGSLSTQNSSNSLLGQPAAVQQHAASHGSRSSGEAVYVSIPPSTSSVTSEPPSVLAPARQTSSERLLSSGQSVGDHISRLISENAAIVEPNPVLLKRRPYNRQNTSSSITSQGGEQGGGSPGLRSPGLQSRIPTTRSQSLHEPAMLNTLRQANGGSLTNGQPILRERILLCPLCGLKFPNEVGLETHQSRCGASSSKKDTLLKQHSQPQLSLGTSSHQQQLLHQQRLQAEHQARISALIGGGAGVAPDNFHQTNTGRNSVPVGAGTSGAVLNRPSPPLHALGERKDSLASLPAGDGRQNSKKRLLDKQDEFVDVVTVGDSRPGSTGPSSAGEPMEAESAPKMAKIQLGPQPDCEPSTSGVSVLHSTSSTSAFAPTAVIAAAAAAAVVAAPAEAIADVSAFDGAAALTLDGIAEALAAADAVAAASTASGATGPFGVPQSAEETEFLRYVRMQVGFVRRGLLPYVVTIQGQDIPWIQSDVNAAVNRRMLKSLTNFSRICQTLPHYRVSGPQESLFAYYSQAAASKEQVDQLFQYLSGYSTKPRINEKAHCKYTIACSSPMLAHPTHSSSSGTRSAQATVLPSTSMDLVNLAMANPALANLINVQVKPEPMEVCQSTGAFELPQAVIVAPTPIALPSPVKQETLSVADTPASTSEHKEVVRYANNTDELVSKKQSFPGAEYAAVAAKIKPISGGRSEEVEVYVRGRGRGRYVCDRCGIKCKKPSMLKKHLKSHTNIRPYTCITCNFSFKTKGNLTKHLFSKTHRRKLEENPNAIGASPSGLAIADDDDEEDDENELPCTSSAEISKRIELESRFLDNNDAEDDDEEEDEDGFALQLPIVSSDSITYRKFGQENILYERETHTPPSVWMRELDKADTEVSTWPLPEMDRSCHSAPPVFDDCREKSTAPSVVMPAASVQALPQTEPNIGMIALSAIVRDGRGSKFAESVSRGDLDAQMQLTSEVIRMSRRSENILPIIRTQEVLEPISRKRTFAGSLVEPALNVFVPKDNFNCDQCSRKFRKESEWNLHKQTHLIEKQQNAKSKSYQCPECFMQLRSRSNLLKHCEQLHPGLDVEAKLRGSPASGTHGAASASGVIANLSNGSAVNVPIGVANPTQPSVSIGPRTTVPQVNGRSFICVDCNLGFRTHGVLAKHLRAKNHVRGLCTAGRLPEDAYTLVRNNQFVLATVDATDCDSARNSLLKIVEKLRTQNGSTSAASSASTSTAANASESAVRVSSLECTEQLSAVSPTPRLPDSGFRQRGSSPPPGQKNGLKRPADEEAGVSGSLCKQGRHTSPTPSPARSTGQRLSISDVWVPPKAEDVDVGARFISVSMSVPQDHPASVTPSPRATPVKLESGGGVGGHGAAVAASAADGNMSDATSRSETSTPQHRHSFSHGSSSSASMSASASTLPTPLAVTRCQICEVQFETPIELQVHFQCEHISVRDGSYFGCPNSMCEKVYPTKEALKSHLMGHYRSGTFVANGIGEREDEFAPPTNQSATSPSDLLSNGGAASPANVLGRKASKTAHTAPKHSPGAPEESHTVTGVGSKDLLNGKKKNELERFVLKCNQCNLEFNDVDLLQSHCATHFSRPHVCSVCDAGFTTLQALQAHSVSHAKASKMSV